MFKVSKATKVILLAITLSLVFVSPVFAYKLIGGKWYGFPIYYYIDGTLYISEINSAANSWTSAGTEVKLYRTNTSGYENVLVRPANYGATPWDGATTNYPSWTANPYTYSYIKLNSYYFDGYTYSKRQHVTAHEMGHIIGLAHEDGVSCVLMNSSGFCAVYPRTDDINGAKALYP